MDIRGLTLEQIEQALEVANKDYNGNLTLKGEPLNKRGDAFKVRLGIKSARRPGSRVSVSAFRDKPRRVASACWHANRDFMRAVFEINPDARIRTALTNSERFAEYSEYYGYGRKRQYTGSDHFEAIYGVTGHSNTDSQMLPTSIQDACNCDEGEYSEFAIEGLTEEQYELRAWVWEDYPDYSHVKAPKRERAILKVEVS
jgi:hypothetical protein